MLAFRTDAKNFKEVFQAMRNKNRLMAQMSDATLFFAHAAGEKKAEKRNKETMQRWDRVEILLKHVQLDTLLQPAASSAPPDLCRSSSAGSRWLAW